MIDLAGKPIAITGASSGIGAATAIACAAAGMPVVLGARRADKLQRVVDVIRGAGGKALPVVMDVCTPGDNQRLIDACVGEFGGVYSVYANAGYGEEAPVMSMSEGQIREMFETNFFGTVSLVRAAVPVLEKNEPGPGGVRGHVLICSSCLGKMWVPYYSVYSATKAAQNHIGRAMNIELRERGVRVSTVHPIGTRTEFFEQAAARSKGDRPLTLHTHDSFLEPAELVASRTVACLRRPRPEVWTSMNGVVVRLGMGLANVMPRISDIAMRALISRRERGRARAGETSRSVEVGHDATNGPERARSSN
ncbi:MAG: SDR family NAD(P)-dependent oxidoreductase [Tepidisphaera sp.]|nr:SDR family NAD(P)-dependent oxidoreductase [Tepidisphaera sp.]